MKKNWLKTLIVFLAVTSGTVSSYANEAEQTILLSVPATVAVQKLDSVESGSISALTGTIDRTLQTVYKIITNGHDSDYDFTLTSSIDTEDGTVSAYGNDGRLLFAHTVSKPSSTAVSNAKLSSGKSANVIAYPTSTSMTTLSLTPSPMTSTFASDYGDFGNCYVIKTNDATDAIFTHSLGTSPVGGTYELGLDEAGSYKATLMLTVTPKVGG